MDGIAELLFIDYVFVSSGGLVVIFGIDMISLLDLYHGGFLSYKIVGVYLSLSSVEAYDIVYAI